MKMFWTIDTKYICVAVLLPVKRGSRHGLSLSRWHVQHQSIACLKSLSSIYLYVCSLLVSIINWLELRYFEEDKGMESASAKCPLGCFGVTPFEENGVSDPTLTTVSLHPFPLSRYSQLAVNGRGTDGSFVLRKVLGQVDRSWLNCAQ